LKLVLPFEGNVLKISLGILKYTFFNESHFPHQFQMHSFLFWRSLFFCAWIFCSKNTVSTSAKKSARRRRLQAKTVRQQMEEDF